MKIFNEENGIKKVYVQMNDIMMLNQLDELIPASIYEKIFTNIVIVYVIKPLRDNIRYIIHGLNIINWIR